MTSLQSEKDKERSRVLELFSNSSELSNLVPNVVRERYPKVSEKIDHKIDLLSKNVSKYISKKQLDGLVNNIIEDRNKFFEILKSELSYLPKKASFTSSQYGFLPENIKVDLTSYGYMSYNNPFGFIAYSKSVNHPSYTLNKDADTLFRKLLNEGRFDCQKTDINILFAGTGILETTWANEINKRNKSKNNNITIIDSSNSALLFRKLFLQNNINSYMKQIESYELCDYINNKMQKDRKCIIIKHNGMACDNLDRNYNELLALRSATKLGDATFFYTLPTITNLTKQNSYIDLNPDTIPFAYSTLKELLQINENDISKFNPVVNTRLLNGHRSLTYDVGYQANEDIEVSNNGDAIIFPEGKVLLLQRSNRYSYASLDSFKNIFGAPRRFVNKSLHLEYDLELNSDKTFAALL
ncbi:MAG: hypothetical protein ACP5N1_04170 [Candidatus Woesearchaeota archaeon]